MLKTKIRGVKYSVAIGKMKGDVVGQCTNPKKKKPTLKFDPAMFLNPKFKKDLLEVLIHEALHACFWDIDEKAIHESGISISRFLKKVGVRCHPKRARSIILRKA